MGAVQNIQVHGAKGGEKKPKAPIEAPDSLRSVAIAKMLIAVPGCVIPVADELLAGRPVGGRIAAVSGKVITLDRDTQAKAGDRLILNLPDGKCEWRAIQVVSGRQVTVTTAYSAVPERELVWALDADDLAIPLYRVTSVARPEPGVFEISAVQYDPSKFAHIDSGARLEERPISVIPITVVPPPASVTLTLSSAVDQGIAISTMNISWPAVSGAVGYDVEWRKDSGNWVKLQRTGSTSVDVTGIYAGAYLARAGGVMGQASADAGPVLDLIKGEVDESIIGKELNKRIDWVDSDGPGSVNDRINQAVKDITDALVYDPSKAYAKGDVVRLGQKIYQAQGPVAVGVAPPAEPWQDIATILEQAGALAGEVHQNTLEISELDGVVTAQAEKIEGVFVQLNPLYSGDTGSYAGTPFLLPFLYQAGIHWMFGVVMAVVVAVIPRCTPNDDYSGMAHE